MDDDVVRLERLHADHAGAVRAFVRRRIGDEVAADDVVAEVFVVAWRLLVTWDGLSHSQAAAVLGVRPATLTMRVHRARRRLTAPRVSPAVRAAVYEALGRTPGSRVVPNVTDPAGPPPRSSPHGSTGRAARRPSS